jgi:rRNA maturation endonuclease Nob1
MNQINLEAERRENLEEYYKYIYKCSLCRKSFGRDFKVRISQETICPVCVMKQSDRGSILSQSKRISRLNGLKQELKYVMRLP